MPKPPGLTIRFGGRSPLSHASSGSLTPRRSIFSICLASSGRRNRTDGVPTDNTPSMRRLVDSHHLARSSSPLPVPPDAFIESNSLSALLLAHGHSTCSRTFNAAVRSVSLNSMGVNDRKCLSALHSLPFPAACFLQANSRRAAHRAMSVTRSAASRRVQPRNCHLVRQLMGMYCATASCTPVDLSPLSTRSSHGHEVAFNRQIQVVASDRYKERWRGQQTDRPMSQAACSRHTPRGRPMRRGHAPAKPGTRAETAGGSPCRSPPT